MTHEEQILRQVRHQQDALGEEVRGVRADLRGVTMRALVPFALTGGLAGVFAAVLVLMIWEGLK